MAVQNILNTNPSVLQALSPGTANQNMADTAISGSENMEQVSPKETDRAELESKGESGRQSERTVDDRMWDDLRHWQPASGISLEKNLNQVQNIYKALLEEIMSGYEGTQQISLMAQLDTYTMDALEQLMNERFQELLSFMEQYGRPTDAQSMTNGLFEDISGRKALLNLNTGSNIGGMLFAMQGSDGKNMSGRSSQGIIYQKDSGSIRINESYQNSVGKSERSGSGAMVFLQRGGYLNSTKAFTPYDIKQLQSFVQYLKNNFSGIEPGKAAYTSEEYLGVSSGILSLKTQIFATQKGLSPEAAAALKYGVNTYIQEYFMQSSQNLRQAFGGGSYKASASFQADDFQKIYRYIVDSYGAGKDAQTSVLNGLQKAYGRFSEKQADSAWQTAVRYASGLGFFSRTQISNLEKEMQNGWRVICKDWNDFLQYAKIEKEKSQRFDYIQNKEYYLASLLASERGNNGRKEKKPNVFQYMTKWGIAMLLASIIAVFFILYFSQ